MNWRKRSIGGMLLLGILVICSDAPHPASAATEPTAFPLPQNFDLLKYIRVAVSKGGKNLSVRWDDPYRIKTIETNQILGERPAEAVEISSIRNGLQIGRQAIKIYGVRLISRGRSIHIGNQTYLDALQVIREANGTLTVVNEIDVETYLRGVLPKEVPSKWPREALKAQAVVARTYALFDELKEFDSDFSLVSTVYSQVYGGESAAQISTNDAVLETKGKILTYSGKIFRTYFHSICGGHTYRAENVWDVDPHPALMGVACPFCRNAPNFHWEAGYSWSELREKLNAFGFHVLDIESITPLDQDIDGRIKDILIQHQGGKERAEGNKFRLALDPGKLRSMNFEMDPTANGIRFQGTGFGHGVGLCQWGMKQMAEEGKTYREILAYYYPGSEIVSVY